MTHLYLIVRRRYHRATVRFAVVVRSGKQRAIDRARARGDEPLDLVRAACGGDALALWREGHPTRRPLPPEDRLRLFVAISSGRGGNAALGRVFGLTRERVRQIRRTVFPAVTP